ncbi:putative nucleosome-remodeling factor subunit BPTF [Monocercomonoides exilis]|uniref:putative nucleosome-remodeling factor subunit BPTF n=1 Tax=Monocercomonoides exilis TaxID=2049356 RepID=UPI0035594FC1|nr:putative nucleosome-remodeling factor subunit BPTF [Monocercomonoides exilis]|eukprot:MONOS_4893.1-p1 / transcript=MONOS_4893.1 / gene=MONOS_4893 / organism=Monocercomonoides_exilis_PA203 / gene_product=unspecified product / transcript_product=unspecified product / location=Mono_scaffold00137:831-2025(-) / protein_length=233 / sequence_SO=supercontig / SO=protein_coding / is_pseudo=false
MPKQAKGGYHQSQQSEEDPNRLWCTCQTPYVEGQFMIQCDMCNEWFHGTCVGITPKQAETMDTYYCDACVAKSQHNKKRLPPSMPGASDASKPSKDVRVEVVRHLESIFKRGAEKCIGVLKSEIDAGVGESEKAQKEREIELVRQVMQSNEKLHEMSVDAERGLKEMCGGEKEKRYRDQYRTIKSKMDSDEAANNPWRLKFFLGEQPAYNMGAAEMSGSVDPAAQPPQHPVLM